MTAARRDRARELCRRLAADVAAVAPTGLGRSDQAWPIVEAPSKAFLALLDQWEVTGDARLVAGIREAYDDVVDAWRRAAALYAESGRAPDVQPRDRAEAFRR